MADPARIEVALAGARADRTTAWFTLGAAADPISVGTHAQWSVVAEAVAPVHLFLGFDGSGVLVAAASPAVAVFVAGSPVGTNWVRVPLPSEVRFGAASLMVRQAGEARADDPGAPSTASDGGALWQLAQRAVKAARAVQVTPGVAAGGSNAPGSQGGDVGAGPRPDFGSTLVIGKVDSPEPRAAEAALVPRPSHAPAAPQAPIPARAPSPWAAPRRSSAAPAAKEAPPYRAPIPQVKDPGQKNFWASASPVKRVTLLLMPFALIGGYLILQEPPRSSGPPPRAIAPSATASARSLATATDQPAVGPFGLEAGAFEEGRVRVSSAALPPVASPPVASPPVASPPVASPPDATTSRRAAANTASPALPRASPGGPKMRTPDRAALDAAASGDFDEAARQYDALIETHPEQTSYRDAARILHEKAARVRSH